MPRITVAAAVMTGVLVSASCQRASQNVEPVDPVAPAAKTTAAPNPATDTVYMCPMDKDIRKHEPGKCPRCGMALVTTIPEPAEYHLDLGVAPAPMPGAPVRLSFAVSDPWKGNPVSRFSVIHEKLFHAFIVSEDLEFFQHGHPEWRAEDSAFTYDVTLPRAGMYRILGDFYPEAATPQLLTKTLFVPGTVAPHRALGRDYAAKQAENLTISISTSPEELQAGLSARVRFALQPADGLQRYLGVWAHMLAVSDDLIDMMHTHPSIADGAHEMQFDIVFPRPRVYRIWVQLQRNGVVNTAHFDVPVKAAAGS